MYKLKTSKFKNAGGTVLKKQYWYTDIKVASSNSHGNHIKASNKFIAFNYDTSNGGSLGIVRLSQSGRQARTLLQAHSGFVTDFDFSPFNDWLLVTGSADQTLKLWVLPEDGLSANWSDADYQLPTQCGRVETLTFNPAAEHVLASTCRNVVSIWDIDRTQLTHELSLNDHIQAFGWKGDGSLCVTSAKDKMIRIIDPRNDVVSLSWTGHGAVKDSRIVWLGDRNHILSSGYNQVRERELCIWDMRNNGEKLATFNMGSSTGVVIPLFDADTNMLFAGGIGDTTMKMFDISDTKPYFNEGCGIVFESQTKGLALLPKTTLDVLNCEVNKLVQLNNNSIAPISFEMMRKTHREFHEDLFPETKSNISSMSSEQWLSGEDIPVSRISLNPNQVQEIIRKPNPFRDENQDVLPLPPQDVAIVTPNPPVAMVIPTPQDVGPSDGEMKNGVVPTCVRLEQEQKDVVSSNNKPSWTPPVPSAASLPSPCPSIPPVNRKFTPLRSSKFRHLKGTVAPRESQILNVPQLVRSLPGQCDGACSNIDRIAVPLAGAGGKIAVFELSTPGRLPDGILPVIETGGSIMDLTWDPFDTHRLAVATDDARIQLWRIPDGGLTDTISQPETELFGHMEKIHNIRFHPLAQDVLVSSSLDLTCVVWDLSTGEQVLQLLGHTDEVFGMNWDPLGHQLATVCKDGIIRVYKPRQHCEPVMELTGPGGTRGARIIWACGGHYLLVTGFDKQSQRQVCVYNITEQIPDPIQVISLDISPAILIPCLDEDTGVVFLSGKGDSTIFAYEVSEQAVPLFELSPVKLGTPHQAVSFLPKQSCDVRQVEFLRAVRVCKNSIEPVSFTVPRVKMQFFQNDIFPDTADVSHATMSSEEWISGENILPQTFSLQPSDMKPVSMVVKPTAVVRKYEAVEKVEVFKTESERKEEIMKSMSVNVSAFENTPLTEGAGVEDDEWEED